MERMTMDLLEGGPEARPVGPSRRSIALGALLAVVVAGLLWVRGTPLFVGWEVARDHERCTTRGRLRARLWSAEPADVRAWLESRGTPVQPLPARAGSNTLLGVRYCALFDRIAGHVYYAGERGYVSLFVLSGPARIGDGWQAEFGDTSVRLLRSAGRTLAIVGASQADVDALSEAFRSTEV